MGNHPDKPDSRVMVQTKCNLEKIGDSLEYQIVGAKLSWVGVTEISASEMLGAEYGIGAYILEAGSLYDLERLFAGVVILSVLGVFVSAVIGVVERYLLNWRT